jgi:hypothetical protein
LGVDPVRGLFAEIVDAEDMARRKHTPHRPKEIAASGLSPLFRQICAKQEVDKQEITVVMVFETLSTTGAPFQGLALGACLNEAGFRHPGRTRFRG